MRSVRPEEMQPSCDLLAVLFASCSLLAAGCGSDERSPSTSARPPAAPPAIYTPEERAGQLVKMVMEKDGLAPDSLECDGPDADGREEAVFYTCRTTEKGSTKPKVWYVSCQTVNTKKPLTRLRDPLGAGDCDLD